MKFWVFGPGGTRTLDNIIDAAGSSSRRIDLRLELLKSSFTSPVIQGFLNPMISNPG